jgi:hypothetical protein
MDKKVDLLSIDTISQKECKMGLQQRRKIKFASD